MKSIFPGMLFGLALMLFLADAVALNKDESLPSEVDKLQADEIKPEQPPIQFNSTRGQMLYENHCLSCHESQMHIRANTKVKQLSQLHYFVLIRSSELKLQWGDDERDAVTDYLNERFYKLPLIKN